MFIPSDRYVFIGGDLSAQEPRITAHLSGDEKMISAYKQGKDLYSEIASIAFHVPYDDCKEFYPDGTTNEAGKERRSIAKKIVLSINYGKGIANLAEDMHKSVQEAREIYNKVMENFPALKDFIADSKQMGKNAGYVTTIFGRKRRLPDLLLPKYEFSFTNGMLLSVNSEQALTRKLDEKWGNDRQIYIEKLRKEDHVVVVDNSSYIARAERQCVNARVQGSAGDQVKIIMKKIYDDEIMNRCKFRLLLQIHDELIGECPIEYAKTAKERLKYIMEHSMDNILSIPSKADIICTDRWYGDELDI